MANMKDFLTMYYNRLIFREMSHEQFVQFCGYIKDKKATDNQKIWAQELLKKDPATGQFLVVPNTNLYVRKDLPDPASPTEGLNDAEWKKLFKAFQSAFQSMDGAKKDFKYNEKATKFLEKYFGSHTTGGVTVHHLFQYTKATTLGRQVIGPAPAGTVPDKTLYGFLKKYPRLELQFKNWGLLTDDFSYNDLLDGIENEKYNKNPKFRKKLEQVAQVIDGYVAGDATMQARLGISDPRTIPDCGDTSLWFDDDNISAFRLDQFKNEYKTLLNTLRTDGKIREVFENHDGGKISGPLNKALNNLSYDNPNSDDYVQPKREDTLTMSERLAEWWDDTYSDCLEKYIKLRPDQLFFSPEAKSIFKHLKKAKKTEGLNDVLKNIGDAKAKLKAARDFKSEKHLAWFEKILKALQSDKKLSHVWAGALKDGTHMQALVKEIMIRAIKEGKKEEAKTALELISVLHYDYTTSKIMDTLKKENLTLFSDGKLSWNKNEGVKFVTNALDKSLKLALMGIGYGITVAGNAYKLSGRKIKRYSDNNGNFAREHDAFLNKQRDDKHDLDVMLHAERVQQAHTQTVVDGIRGTRSYDVAKTDIETSLAGLQTRVNNTQMALHQQKQDLLDIIYDSTTGACRISNTDASAIYHFLEDLNNPTLPTVPVLAAPIVTIGGITYDLAHMLNRILLRQRVYRQRTANRDTEQDKLNQLVEGKELLDQLNAQIIQHQNEFDNWDTNHVDDLEELVQHWNMLETGRNTKTGPMFNWFRNLSAKKAQKNFNARIPQIITEYNRSHSIAA
ncbi:MAG: hypothetical protein IKW57_00705 [Alphaproteobacteria bacterium]|nr:hypothetical protein [Alphaproteobacteria bacterium]